MRAARALRRSLPVGSVLILCTANLVRSPFAERVLAARLGSGVRIHSRGVLPGGGTPPPEAVDVASALGFRLEGHISRQLEPAELVSAGAVMVMERQMAREIGMRYPAVLPRLHLLGHFDPEAGWGEDVEDPYMLTRDDYLTAYERIQRCCIAVAQHLDEHKRGSV